MGSLRSAGYKIGFGCLLLAGLGCLASGSKGTSVQVIDGETKQPISAAQVRVWHYQQANSANAHSTINTNGKGNADLQTVSGRTDDLVLEVSAKGYATEEKSINLADHVEVQMYAEPNPTVEIIAPNLFRGLFNFRMRIQDSAPMKPGQRLFSFEMQDGDLVEAVVPTLFRHMNPEFRARFADGRPMPERPQGQELGLWWIKTSGEFDIFLIGTQGDYEAYWREHPNEHPTERKGKAHGGKAGHGGQGRNGGRGDAPSGESISGP
ncbi:MAG TPA: hypothetical protein VKS79_03420 [Gemmataceae bacterium]|nr:hypothetical protein [Gemmataceae bacterium]